MEMMTNGGHFFKHDFGRNKRSKKLVKLSKDGLKLTWTASSGGKSGSGTDRDSPSKGGGGILRSASFGKTTSGPLSPPPPFRLRPSRIRAARAPLRRSRRYAFVGAASCDRRRHASETWIRCRCWSCDWLQRLQWCYRQPGWSSAASA